MTKWLNWKQVAQIWRGQWMEDADGDGRTCSRCGADYCYLLCDAERYRFCPACGAAMDDGAVGEVLERWEDAWEAFYGGGEEQCRSRETR